MRSCRANVEVVPSSLWHRRHEPALARTGHWRTTESVRGLRDDFDKAAQAAALQSRWKVGQLKGAEGGFVMTIVFLHDGQIAQTGTSLGSHRIRYGELHIGFGGAECFVQSTQLGHPPLRDRLLLRTRRVVEQNDTAGVEP